MKNGNKGRQRYVDNINPAIKELTSYRYLLVDIKNVKLELDEARQQMDTLKAIRYDVPRVQGGTGESAIELAVIRFIELEKKYSSILHNKIEQMSKIEQKMEKLEKRQEKVLRLYFIEGFNIERIAYEMSYSEIQIKRIKSDGLRKYSSL